MSPKKIAPVLVLVLVLALVGVAWWLKQPTSVGGAGSHATASARTTSGATTKATKKSTAPASGAVDPQTGLRWIEESALPKEAQTVLAKIDRGGPYDYAKDGTNFGNFEGVLPKKPSGFYKEYTVKTPGENDRGARRIVTGDHDKQFFYTDDHYATFSRVKR